MKLTKAVSSEVWYAPDIKFGEVTNRKSADPFKVKIRALTACELDSVEVGFAAKITKLETVDERWNAARDCRIEACVSEVVNLEIDDVAITDGATLVKALRSVDQQTRDAILGDIEQAIKDHSKLRSGIVSD